MSTATLPAEFFHGACVTEIISIFGQHCDQHDPGIVMSGGVGVHTYRYPEAIRAGDVLFIFHARFQQVKSGYYLDVAPELVVEVLSSRDSWVDMAEKLEDYFSIGVVQVWFANPRNKTLQIFTSITDSVLLRGGDSLAEIPFMPGFQLNVSEIYS